MGRSRSRRRDKEKDKEKKRSRSREKKDKDRKRSRSREKKEKKEKERKEKEERQQPVQEERKRSPSLQYRKWRFDSPPKEEDYQRDAMLTANPMGLGGVSAILQGGLAVGGISNVLNPLAMAADTKSMRELYVGNLPAGITAPQLVQFLNQVAQAVKVNQLPGEPVLGATMGSGGQFAFVEFRTAEEAANGLRLNGVELLGCQLKVGRPKTYAGPESAGTGVLAGLQTGGQLAIGSGQPSLGEMMAQHGALRPNLSLPGLPGMHAVNAIDHRLCLVNIPTFVTEDRIKELLITFGQLKFFALQKDEDNKSVGVAFFEYNDMMTQQQARAALEGLELGSQRLSVKKPEQVLELGLVNRIQKLGPRVIPSKILYLKNIVTVEDLSDDAGYAEICADIRLEAEKFGAVVSIEVPRGGRGGASGIPLNALPAPGVFALEDTKPAALEDSTKALPVALPSGSSVKKDEDDVKDEKDIKDEKVEPAESTLAKPASSEAKPEAHDFSTALVPVGAALAKLGSVAPGMSQGGPIDPNAPGIGYAFIEFATVEGSSKAKKGLNGRRFGPNTVEAEYFSEEKFHMRDFERPLPNTDEPRREAAMELALLEGGGGLDEAPVMVE